jgi:protein TonB
LQGSLIRRVEPAYPQLAKNARIQGPVVLAAVISKAGTIEDLRVISGHPMLVKAAIDAVSQWRYRPYILNGDAVEVDTQITVNFTLGGS